MSLPEGWNHLKGASCAGWDIWLGFCPDQPEHRQHAIFRRRISKQETYTKGKTYPTLSAGDQAIEVIRGCFHAGKYQFDDLFPREVIIDHPNFGAF